jgi:hypothetical protein
VQEWRGRGVLRRLKQEISRDLESREERRVSQWSQGTGTAQRLRASLQVEENTGWPPGGSGQWLGKVDFAQAQSVPGRLRRTRVQRVVREFQDWLA